MISLEASHVSVMQFLLEESGWEYSAQVSHVPSAFKIWVEVVQVSAAQAVLAEFGFVYSAQVSQ
jgi:hypothetical protein